MVRPRKSSEGRLHKARGELDPHFPRAVANRQSGLRGLLGLTVVDLQIDVLNKLEEANVCKSTVVLDTRYSLFLRPSSPSLISKTAVFFSSIDAVR